MNKERLLRLADFLEKEVPAKKFYMGKWANGLDPNMCGTSACACGWATTIPEFKEAGLCLKLSPWNIVVLSYKHEDHMEAAATFFDIGYGVACHFFDAEEADEEGNPIFDDDDDYIPRSDETPLQVAARIRAYVAKHGTP